MQRLVIPDTMAVKVPPSNSGVGGVAKAGLQLAMPQIATIRRNRNAFIVNLNFFLEGDCGAYLD
jgi:hypothetical protein